MFALAMEYGGAHALGQVLELIAQGQDQAVVECIALARTVQRDDGQLLLLAGQGHLKVWVLHGQDCKVNAIMVI
jgi:hypothetical protein